MADTTDTDFLPPDVDPDKKLLGVREIRATNDAEAKTVSRVRDFEITTDEKTGTNIGPSPLETVLCALSGCEGVIINRCADAMGFAYSAVHMEAEGEVDQRGSRGVQGVRPYFNWVRLEIRVTSAESQERFDKLAKNVEYRCPVMNLFREAGVDVQADWHLVAD